MWSSTVVASLARLDTSIKLAAPVAQIGALRLDRSVGIAGVVGAEPKMVPLRVGLNPAWLPLPGWAGVLFSPSAKLMSLNPLSGWLMAQQGGREGVLQRLLDSTGSRLSAEAAAHYGVLLRNARHVRGVLAMMAAWNLNPLAQRLHALPAQVHMHIGLADQTIPPALAQVALQRIPGSTCAQAAGLGHLAHEENPAEVAHHLLRWMACGTP
jgi:magnesium chelatase accessory protein